jgi:hypothetical protein
MKMTIRRNQPPPKPTRVTDADLMRWWKRFIDGEPPFMIAETEGKELSSVEKGLAYVAHKLGSPEPGVERCRLIEHHHKSMVALNEQIERSRQAVVDIDKDLSFFSADLEVKDKLRAARTRELGVQIKLYAEVRNIAAALESLFQLKTVPLPVEVEESDDRGVFDTWSHEQMAKLLEQATTEQIPDAEEISETPS